MCLTLGSSEFGSCGGAAAEALDVDVPQALHQRIYPLRLHRAHLQTPGEQALELSFELPAKSPTCFITAAWEQHLTLQYRGSKEQHTRVNSVHVVQYISLSLQKGLKHWEHYCPPSTGCAKCNRGTS